MNKQEKDTLKEFLHFSIKSFLSELIEIYYQREGKKWEGVQYIIDSGEVLREVLSHICEEVHEEHKDFLLNEMDQILTKIGK